MSELTLFGQAAGTGSATLHLQDLHVAYGDIRAVQGVTLEIGTGITALVGANGAGKSSVVGAIAGVVPTVRGDIRLHGCSLAKVPSHARVLELGIVLVPEGRGVIPDMTVLENLTFGIRIGRLRRERGITTSSDAGRLQPLLDLFPTLASKQHLHARLLSGGEQQMLSVARALASAPAVLCIDEPSLGLSPSVVRDLLGTIKEVSERDDICVLLIEQDTQLALRVATYGYVMERGAIVAQGPSSELAASPLLRSAYLGEAGSGGMP